MSPSDWIQLGIGVVLFVTLCAVLWYSCETRQMRIEMERGRLASIDPIIGIKVAGSAVHSVTVKLTNVGKGPAFGVECVVKHPAFDLPGKKIWLHALQAGCWEEQAIHADAGAPEFHGADVVACYENQYGHEIISTLDGVNLELRVEGIGAKRRIRVRAGTAPSP